MLSLPTVAVISSTIAVANGRTCETSDSEDFVKKYADDELVKAAQECAIGAGIVFDLENLDLPTIVAAVCESEACHKVAEAIITVEAPDCEIHGVNAKDALETLLVEFKKQWETCPDLVGGSSDGPDTDSSAYTPDDDKTGVKNDSAASAMSLGAALFAVNALMYFL